jgi:hypothetical protein
MLTSLCLFIARLQLQFLLTPDRKHVKLNDFNRMEVMLWDDNDQAYCRYRNGEGQGNVRTVASLGTDQRPKQFKAYESSFTF